MVPPRSSYTSRRLGEGMRRKLEVTSAMAWEALVETHVEQAAQFVHLLEDHEPVQESLPRYLRELDLGDTMATAIRTRVLMRLEDEAGTAAATTSDDAGALDLPTGDGHANADPEGWSRLLRPQRVVQDVIRRQRRNDEAERIALLAIARAEENVIKTHVENAISFVALLAPHMALDRAVQQYIIAVSLAGSRAQAVYQRTMARLADVHLPV